MNETETTQAAPITASSFFDRPRYKSSKSRSVPESRSVLSGFLTPRSGSGEHTERGANVTTMLPCPI